MLTDADKADLDEASGSPLHQAMFEWLHAHPDAKSLHLTIERRSDPRPLMLTCRVRLLPEWSETNS